MAITLSTAAKNTRCNAVVDLLDLGSTTATGKAVFKTSGVLRSERSYSLILRLEMPQQAAQPSAQPREMTWLMPQAPSQPVSFKTEIIRWSLASQSQPQVEMVPL